MRTFQMDIRQATIGGIVLGVLVCALQGWGAIQVNPDLLTKQWPAKWISVSGATSGLVNFRSSFTLQAPLPASMVVHVSADERFKLYVNGKYVAEGPGRGEFEQYHFESVDIGPKLRKGKNVIAAEVWNWGDSGPWAYRRISAGLQFILQADKSENDIVNTGANWKAKLNAGYAFYRAGGTMPYGPPVIIPPGEKLTGSVYPWGWQGVDFDDSGWGAPAVGAPGCPMGSGCTDKYKLVQSMLPLMEASTEMRFSQIDRISGASDPGLGFLKGTSDWIIPANRQVAILLDQTFVTTAYYDMIVSGGAGSSITFICTEALFLDSTKINRDQAPGSASINGVQDQFLPDGGLKRHFQTLWCRPYRFVQLEIKTGGNPLAIHDFKGIFNAYPFQQKGTFTCDDAAINRVMDICWRTNRNCSHDVYWDGAMFEQLQYSGDAYMAAVINMYVSGDDRLMKNCIDQFYHTRQKATGLFNGIAPQEEEKGLVTYALFWILMLYDHYWLTGDASLLKKYDDGIKLVIDWYKKYVDASGMLSGLPNDMANASRLWDWDYWWYIDVGLSGLYGAPVGVENKSSVLTLLFAYTLKCAAELETVIGNNADAQTMRTLLDQVNTGTYQQCWDASKGILADLPSKTPLSQHANILGILSGAIPANQGNAVMQKVLNASGMQKVSIYFMSYFFHRVLGNVGMGNHFLDLLSQWKQLASWGMTTTPEFFDISPRSDCHTAAAHPAINLLALTAGVRPATPGFKTVNITPYLGSLTRVDATVPTPQGIIQVSWRKDAGGLSGTIELPAGVSGTLVDGGKSLAVEPGKSQYKNGVLSILR